MDLSMACYNAEMFPLDHYNYNSEPQAVDLSIKKPSTSNDSTPSQSNGHVKKTKYKKVHQSWKEVAKKLSKKPNAPPKVKKLFKCPFCAKRFRSLYWAIRHEVTHTPDMMPYQCITCMLLFKSSCQLYKHKKVCVTPINFDSDNRNLSSLKQETDALMQAFHNAVAMQYADNPSYVSYLQKHKNDHKLNETGGYRCEDCGKVVSSPYYLTQHRKIHTGVRPYQCTECTRAFMRRFDLKRHIRTVHTSKWLSKDFKWEYQRNRNVKPLMLTADDVKNYVELDEVAQLFRCCLCGSTCSTRGGIYRHIRQYCLQRKKIEGGEENHQSIDIEGGDNRPSPSVKKVRSRKNHHKNVKIEAGVSDNLRQSFKLETGEYLYQNFKLEAGDNGHQGGESLLQSFKVEAGVNHHQGFKVEAGDNPHQSVQIVRGIDSRGGSTDYNTNANHDLNSTSSIPVSTVLVPTMPNAKLPSLLLVDPTRAHAPSNVVAPPNIVKTKAAPKIPKAPPVPRVRETFTCPDCSRVFQRKRDYERHLTTRHVHARIGDPKICPCGEPFKSIYKCHDHMVICPVVINTKKEEQAKKLLEENQEKQSDSNTNNSDAVSDLSSIQPQNPQDSLNGWECIHCGKFLKNESSLRSHLNTHVTERKHGCLECGKFFRRRTDLRRHDMNVHSGERPFQCDECGQQFKRNSHLVKHRSDYCLGRGGQPSAESDSLLAPGPDTSADGDNMPMPVVNQTAV